ncbi:MAG: XkdF-like putative serine protease domain-containing protein [Prevotella sp.]|nr:XkdF-like putative serine protease domain-containing protein [Prevotella sp.]
MKLYDIYIDPTDFETGMDAISLVADPAVEVDFLKFGKDKPMSLNFADEERHIITGIALLADTPIYRIAPDGTEYYVRFTKDCIRQLVEKYFKFGLTNSVNIEHKDNQFVDGVTMLESYIIDKERGICPNEFASAPDGSWVVSYKVNNLDVWDKIKTGEVMGFSIQGIFHLVESKLEMNNNKPEEEISENKNNISLMSKLKEKIKALLMQYAAVSTDKGNLIYNTDMLEVGSEVFVEDENGENVPAADGEYMLEDGRTVEVEGGKVTEIKAKEEETPAEPEMKPAEEQMAEPEMPAEPETPAETPAENEKVTALEERVATLESQLADVIAKLAEIQTTPAASPAEEEFDNIKKPKVDPKNKMAAIAAAYRAAKERK